MSSINFNNTPSHNKTLASTATNNISKDECKLIYNNIKNGLPIKNPRTGKTIVYHSPITQKILKTCYKKFKMTQLPDVINPRNLFGNKTPPQISSASSGSLSPPSNFKKHSSSPLPLSPSSSYGPPQSPSPPSSPPAARKQSPVVRSPSPPAARKQSPAKTGNVFKKLNFTGVADTIKSVSDKRKYTALTDEKCKAVINQIATKQEIINPISNKTLLSTSPITKYILYSCYYDRGIKEVEDVVEINTLCDKPPVIKNNYTGIYDNFKKLKLHYTEDKLNALFNDTGLDTKYLADFKAYIASCKSIEKKQNIGFNVLCKHMAIIFKLLHINSKSTIALYDDKFLDNLQTAGYASIKIVENKLPASYNNLYNYIDILTGSVNIADKKTLLCNSIFNRIYVFSYKDDVIEFCPYNKSSLRMNNFNNIPNIIKDSNKTVPKYFAYSYSSNDETSISNKLNYITAFLTAFASDFLSNIEILETTSIEKINELRQLFLNTTKNEAQDLATILYNNAIFNSLKINTPIVTNFNGTVNRSTVNIFRYIDNILYYQTYNISPTMLETIANNYKNFLHLPLSKNLNIELTNFILDINFKLSYSVKQRLIEMFNFTKEADKNVNYDKSLFLFHGTSGRLNSNLLTAFLSTSFNIDIAVSYSSNNLNPHIYIFRINSNNIKYINFADGLQQLLLLPGTILIERNSFKHNKFTFIICDIEMPNKMYISNLFNNIQTYDSNYKLKKIVFKTKNYTNPYVNIIIYESFNYISIQPFRDNINITHNDKYLICELLKESASVDNIFLNLKYTIHQLIINNIYSYFMGDKIIKYNVISYSYPVILTGWLYDKTLKTTLNTSNYKYDYDFLIIDILCNNFDLANNISYLLTSSNEVRKVWCKTTGIFNGIACQTITEDDTKDISKLNSIFKKDTNTIIDTNTIYKNNKVDIEQFVNKYMVLIQKCKTDNIINAIIEQYKHFIDNVLSIPNDSEEYKQLYILLQTIQNYFEAKINYMLSLDKNDLIKTINNKMPLTGGKDTKLSSSSSSKSIKQSKSKNSSKNIDMNTDPTIFDKEGYEIAPQYYSSMHTISSTSFKSIQAFKKL